VSKLIFEDEVEFPNVAFCNINPFTTNDSLSYLNSINIPVMNYSEKIESITNLAHQNETWKKYFLTQIRKLDDNTKKSFGLSVNKTFLRCKFLNVDCNLNDFGWFYDHHHGNCHIFNPKGKKVKMAGQKNLLEVELFTGLESITPSFHGGSGFKLLIFSSSEDIKYSGKLDKISVATRSESTIVLSRFKRQKLRNPYSDCKLDNENQNKFQSKFIVDKIAKNITYKKVNCLQYHLEQEILSACECKIVSDESLLNVEWCDTTEQKLKCAFNIDNRFNYGDLGKKYDEQCPIECEWSYFDYKMSVNSFPTKSYATYLKGTKEFLKNLSVEVVSESVSRVNIYLESLAYEFIKEEATYPGLVLVGNIGGILGLALGMSLLSFIEIFEVLLIVCFITYDWLKKYFKKKLVKQKIFRLKK